jgi:hypothetical protein
MAFSGRSQWVERDAHQPASFVNGQPCGPVITDILPLLGRGAFLSAPCRNSSSSACLPTSRSSAAMRGLVFLQEIGGLGIVIQPAFLIFAYPDPNQIARQIVPFRQAVQRLAGDEFCAAWRLKVML